MERLKTVIYYELSNILRSKWLYMLTCIVALMTSVFLYVSGDTKKTLLSLTIIFCALIPLIALLFTSLYWYNSERFTELLLTQPIPRRIIYASRSFVLSTSLIFSLSAGVILPFLWFRVYHADILFFIGLMSTLSFIFVQMALLISVTMNDKMKALGIILGVWLYLLVVHDGIILVSLIALKDYPTDILALLAGTLNPIGLVRIVLIRYFDQPLLLSFTGARVQLFIGSATGLIFAIFTALLWIIVPLYAGSKAFIKRDY